MAGGRGHLGEESRTWSPVLTGMKVPLVPAGKVPLYRVHHPALAHRPPDEP